MSNKLYPFGKQDLLTASFSWTSGTIKLAMVTSAYTQSDSHQYYATSVSPTGAVVATAFLTATGAALGVATAASITFSTVAAGSTITGLVVYDNTSGLLLAWYDHNSVGGAISVVTNGGDITWTWPASTLFSL